MIDAGNQHPQLSIWIENFKKAAKLYHDGRRDLDIEMECDGYEHAMLLIKDLDQTGSTARDVLIPLLDDPDFEVRVIAAAYVAKHKPELALPVLKQIQASAELEAGMTAMHLLWQYEHKELDI